MNRSVIEIDRATWRLFLRGFSGSFENTVGLETPSRAEGSSYWALLHARNYPEATRCSSSVISFLRDFGIPKGTSQETAGRRPRGLTIDSASIVCKRNGNPNKLLHAFSSVLNYVYFFQLSRYGLSIPQSKTKIFYCKFGGEREIFAIKEI